MAATAFKSDGQRETRNAIGPRMKLRYLVALNIALCVLPGLTVATVIGMAAIRVAPSTGLSDTINPLLTIAFAAGMLSSLGAWFIASRYLLTPLAALAREAQRHSIGVSEEVISVRRDAAVSELVNAVAGLGSTLNKTKQATEERIREATGLADTQKRRLEAILIDLTEGVIVCNRDHRIILYNEAARRILGLREMTGLGRSVFGIIARDPVIHTLDILMREQAHTGQSGRRFMVATVDLATLIDTRMSLIREPTGEHAGYVLSFQDIGQQIESLSARDALLREVMVEWRRPIANLSAAIETFTDAGDLSAKERAGFEEILRKEVAQLATRFRSAAQRAERLDLGHWGTADVHSLDLFRSVENALRSDPSVGVRLVGLPMWINADSHAITLALTHLIRHLGADYGVRSVDLGISRSGKHAHVEIGWVGRPVPTDELDSWLDQPLAGAVATRSTRQIIERHGADIWSTEAGDGGAVLRVPLRPSERHHELTAKQASSGISTSRPEYYDFDLFRSAPETLADTPLRTLRYVVFDTETTGLQPSQGDELLSIGAVQVLNGRILTNETFERLINPERDIPPLSTRFHGITADQIAGKPPARIVLPQFRAFAGDAVLVAYNIAFDMTFLHKRQEEAGVSFDNPVLDALLLAIHVFPDHSDPSLSSMARHLDIQVEGRHTALGDALMTAAVWVRIIEGLERKGVSTFGQAVAISDRMLQERRLKEKF
ncbi:MAG: exonuclease domain-containing protein [Hyphomicrobiaceae bacterium]